MKGRQQVESNNLAIQSDLFDPHLEVTGLPQDRSLAPKRSL